jgi:hypothetical protein
MWAAAAVAAWSKVHAMCCARMYGALGYGSIAGLAMIGVASGALLFRASAPLPHRQSRMRWWSLGGALALPFVFYAAGLVYPGLVYFALWFVGYFYGRSL